MSNSFIPGLLRSVLRCGVACCCVLAWLGDASATSFTFAVQSSSNLTLSGTYFNGSITVPLQQQSLGSLFTTGSGSFLVDIDGPVTQLSFLAGQSVVANNTNGGANFFPNTQPANWAFQAITVGPNNGLFGAIRGTTEEMTSAAKTLTPTGPSAWQFNSTGVNVGITAGTMFTQAMVSGAPFSSVSSNSFVGETGANAPASPTATLVEASGIYTLTVPVDVTYTKTQSGQTFTLHFTGSVIATSPAPVVVNPLPEPGSLLLSGCGLLGLLSYRRKKVR